LRGGKGIEKEEKVMPTFSYYVSARKHHTKTYDHTFEGTVSAGSELEARQKVAKKLSKKGFAMHLYTSSFSVKRRKK
jgi:hypothetical protein